MGRGVGCVLRDESNIRATMCKNFICKNSGTQAFEKDNGALIYKLISSILNKTSARGQGFKVCLILLQIAVVLFIIKNCAAYRAVLPLQFLATVQEDQLDA